MNFVLNRMPSTEWWSRLELRLQAVRDDYARDDATDGDLINLLSRWATRALKTINAPFAAGVLAVIRDEGEARVHLERLVVGVLEKPRTPEMHAEPAGGRSLEKWAAEMLERSPLRIGEE